MSETIETSKTEDVVVVPQKVVPLIKAILARKVGMTRVFNSRGEVVPVTVLEAGPCDVVQVKDLKTHGYASIQVGFGNAKAKNVSKGALGHYKKAGVLPHRWLKEFRLPNVDGFEPGMVVRVEQFQTGDVVDISGTIKGKGFAGAVKRHRFKGGPQTHGQSDRWRAPGSSGRERVWPGKRGPGHMGAETGTTQRLNVVSVDPESNVMLIEGSVPGPNGGCVSVYKTTRPRRAPKISAVSKKSVKAAVKSAKAPAKPAK